MRPTKNTFLHRLCLIYSLMHALCYEVEQYIPTRTIKEAILITRQFSSSKTLSSEDGVCHAPIAANEEDRIHHQDHAIHSHHRHGRSMTDLISLQTMIPSCGETVCDIPSLQKSYIDNVHFIALKTLKYRVINLANDDGQFATVTPEQIASQHQFINQAFQHVNISWEVTVLNVMNTALRQRTVIYGCALSNVGDGDCDDMCNEVITGQDGGDCNSEKSTTGCAAKSGDGKCDSSCNQVYNNYDGGDCCNPSITDTHLYCFDPDSLDRAYLTIEEYKVLLNLPNYDYLNVYFAYWTSLSLLGSATFPWDKNVYGIRGGTIMNPNTYGVEPIGTVGSKAMVHEIGHNLGLWHTHRGYSEIKCTEACVGDGAELGDFCTDTGPSPTNTRCQVSTDESCGISHWPDTAFHNYMSYSLKECDSWFSPQQIARMHCHIDLAYPGWHHVPVPPSFIPVPPSVTGITGNTITLGWHEPFALNGGQSAAGILCSQCSGSNSSILLQYAHVVTEYLTTEPSTSDNPENMIGANDVFPCSGKEYSSTASHMPKGSWSIQISFEKPVYADILTIFFNYYSIYETYTMTLEVKDQGESVWKSIGSPTFSGKISRCENKIYLSSLQPGLGRIFDLRLNSTTKLAQIDAFRIQSLPNSLHCNLCQPVEYIINRDPPFSNVPTSKVVSQELDGGGGTYQDTLSNNNQIYTYNVQARGRFGDSFQSPDLKFSLADPRCGDGKVDSGENCDDNNLVNGDGCSRLCLTENSFHCDNSVIPSNCYVHCGDNKCETFEQDPCCYEDCGICTPPGKLDQWGSINFPASARIEDAVFPANSTRGEMDSQYQNGNHQRCGGRPTVYANTVSKVWNPGSSLGFYGEFWVQVRLDKAVLATSVAVYLNAYTTSDIAIDLIDTNGTFHRVVEKTQINCADELDSFPLVYDLTKLYFTESVRATIFSGTTYVDAIRVRSTAGFEPIQCGPGTRISAGACVPNIVCGPKTQLENLKCVALVKCTNNRTIVVNGKCVPIPGLTCGNGTREVNRVCVSTKCGNTTHEQNINGQSFCVPKVNPLTCGPKTRVINGTCVGLKCGSGTHVDNGVCVPDNSPVTCGTGVTKINGMCVGSITCGSSTNLNMGTCLPTRCDSSTREINGVCVGTTTCGTGTYTENGYCVRAQSC